MLVEKGLVRGIKVANSGEEFATRKKNWRRRGRRGELRCGGGGVKREEK